MRQAGSHDASRIILCISSAIRLDKYTLALGFPEAWTSQDDRAFTKEFGWPGPWSFFLNPLPQVLPPKSRIYSQLALFNFQFEQNFWSRETHNSFALNYHIEVLGTESSEWCFSLEDIILIPGSFHYYNSGISHLRHILGMDESTVENINIYSAYF